MPLDETDETDETGNASLTYRAVYWAIATTWSTVSRGWRAWCNLLDVT
jgi:hypothetical protein